MKALTSLVCITTLLHHPVYSYNTNRYGDTCYYYENPNLVPIFRSRSSSQMSPYFTQDDRSPEDQVVYGYFPGQDVEPQPDKLMKNFNIGYLNVNEPIGTIGDLMDMNSEEIGYSKPKVAAQEPSKLWKVDEVKNLAAPEVLPDIVLQPEAHDGEETPEVPIEQQILDEHEIKLGRKLVDDSPSIPDLMPVEKSLRQETEDMGDVEIDEQYLRAAQSNKPPSVVLDTIIPREEPDFMQELEQIKFENQEPNEEQVEQYNYEPVTSMPISPEVLPDTFESSTESAPVTTVTVPDNIIGKDTNEEPTLESLPKTEVKKSKKRSKKKKKSKQVNREESVVTNTEAPSVSTRFSKPDDTLLDGLLSVM